MFATWLKDSDLLVWPLVGLGIFFVTFLAVLVRVAVARGSRTARLASLPLDDDDDVQPAEGRGR